MDENRVISNFPNLTDEEFTTTLQYLEKILQKTDLRYSLDNECATIHREVHMGISQPETGNCNDEDPDDVDIEFEEDEDEERLSRPPKPQEIIDIEYSIILSPIYCVPVLYFIVTIDSRPAGLDDIYRFLVDSSGQGEAIKSTGLIGAISQQDHPVRGTPAWFIHPCQTAETLSQWSEEAANGGMAITLKNYLPIWIGIVGGCVGLHLPAQAVASQQAA